MTRTERCQCCGSQAGFVQTNVLWPELIRQWGLGDREASLIDRQQGYHCKSCQANWRSQALAYALIQQLGFDGVLSELPKHPVARQLRLLEVNGAGMLTPWLSQLPYYSIVHFPAVRMEVLPFRPGTFTHVLHSDTLEHVIDPVGGLRDCRRVLAAGGACLFTVPIVPGRLNRRRRLEDEPSYHGTAPSAERGSCPDDHRVWTEYGSDVWEHVLQAGFSRCEIVAYEYPAALAIVARGGSTP